VKHELALYTRLRLRLLSYLGYLTIVMGIAFRGIVVLVTFVIGFNNMGFIGALISDLGRIDVGLHLVLLSKGMMD